MGLPLLFVAVSVVELMVLAAVENRVGLPATLAAIVLTGVLGATLVRAQGFRVVGQARDQLRGGVFPGRELAHGAMVLVGGVFLITPGFLTDGLGLALMVPAFRELVRAGGVRYLERRARAR